MLAIPLPAPDLCGDLGHSLHKHLMMSDTFVDTEILAILHNTQEIFVPLHFVRPIKAVVNIVLPPCLQDIFKYSQHNSSERLEHYFEVEIQMTEWLYALQHTSHTSHSVSVEYDWDGSMVQFNFSHTGPHDIDMLTRDECRRVMHVALVFLHHTKRTIPMLKAMLEQWRCITGITCQQQLPQLTSQFPNLAHLDPQLQPSFDPNDPHPDIKTWVLCRQLDDIHYTGALPTVLQPLPTHIIDILPTDHQAFMTVHKALFAPHFVPPIFQTHSASTETCTICFELLFAGTHTTMTRCGHFFCATCHAIWAAQSDECAVCRQSLEPEQAAAPAPGPYIPEYDTSEDEEEEEGEEYILGARLDHIWR